MVCSLAETPNVGRTIPAKWRIQPVLAKAGLNDIAAVQEQVWSRKFDWLVEQLLQTMERSPQKLSIYCAYAGDKPIGTGWTEFPEGSIFPEIHGGAVLSEWRGQGVYSELYNVRMAEARARGYNYLTVDATPMSRPILEKLGFQYVCHTIPMRRAVD
jgi:GNAT superfamily N-acetyltransferase